MKHGRDFPTIFRSYVELPEGKPSFSYGFPMVEVYSLRFPGTGTTCHARHGTFPLDRFRAEFSIFKHPIGRMEYAKWGPQDR